MLAVDSSGQPRAGPLTPEAPSNQNSGLAFGRLFWYAGGEQSQ